MRVLKLQFNNCNLLYAYEMNHDVKSQSEDNNDSTQQSLTVSITRLNLSHSKEEIAANTAISDLITQITVLTKRQDPLLKSIKSSKLLIQGLQQLRDLVEMVDIKYSIVSQIKFLITNQARKIATDNSAKFEGHMLHSIISGNPGTGKTTVAMILARIWMALGFVEKNTQPTSVSSAVAQAVNDTYRQRVKTLEQSDYDNRRHLYYLKGILPQCRTVATAIRHQVIRLKPGPQRAPDLKLQEEWDLLLKQTHNLRVNLDQITKNLELGIACDTGIIKDDNDEEPKFIIAKREDLIAEFVGQTAPKTRKVLESARGGVLFIDEAYSICNMIGGVSDRYGEECVNTINEFMSLYPDEIILILAGYKDKIINNIFKVQPGMSRRFKYFFEIKDYTNKGLAKIFIRHLAKDSWYLEPNINLERIFNENIDIINRSGGGGGFTEKLAFFTKLVYSESKFDEIVEKGGASDISLYDSIISDKMLCIAMKRLHDSFADIANDKPPYGMYL